MREKLGSVTRPVKELNALFCITLKTGERKTVTFDFAPQISGREHRHEAVVEPGDLDIMVGPTSVDLTTETLPIRD